jgi:hypothetical protein
MGIQSSPQPLRVRYATPEDKTKFEPSVVKRCQKLMEVAKSHPLPVEAQKLKLLILETHPIRTSRFSLSHMKRLAVPPVEVPKGLCGKAVTGTVVAGKKVPFSRDMWENRKRKAEKKRLDSIYELITY